MGLTKELVIARAEQRFESVKENDPCFRCDFADKENFVCMNDGLPLGDGWKCRSFRENNGGDRKAPRKRGYEMGTGRYKIIGRLHRTGRRFRGVGVGKRTIHEDEAGQEWAKAFNKWWKFPQEVEY